jgi:nicotinamidase-related amidase
MAHPHADLDPKRTALVVVDLQNAFMADAVGHAVCPSLVAFYAVFRDVMDTDHVIQRLTRNN